MDIPRIAQDLHDLADELDPEEETPVGDYIVLLTNTNTIVRPSTWTSIPMPYYGGDKALRTADGYIAAQYGAWLWGAYLRIAPNSGGQIVVRFVRDIGGVHDSTGADDRVLSPGKEHVNATWFFHPVVTGIPVGSPTGWEIWQGTGQDITIEHAQVKAVRL